MYRIFTVIGVCVAGLIFLTSFSSQKPRADFVFVNRGDVFTLDPQRMSWLNDMQIAYCLYEGVVRWNTEDFSIEPAASESFNVSDDGKTYTFNLRKDARWSNGASVTAYDFVYSWMRLLTPDTSSDYSSFFFSISGAKGFWDWRTEQLENNIVFTIEEIEDVFNRMVKITAKNDYVLVVELDRPISYFLDQLALAVCSPVYKPSVEGWDVRGEPSKLAITDGWNNVEPPPISKRKWIDVDKDTGRITQQYFWARPETIVGNGPFVLEDWRYKRDMWLRANPMYHSRQHVGVKSIQALTITDSNTAVLAFEGGEIDWLNGVNVDYQVDMLAEKDRGERSNIHATPTFGTDFFSFNCRDTLQDGSNNPFKNAGVRRAFVFGTDRQAIVDYATRLREPVVTSIVPPNSIKGYGQVVGLGFDVDRAREELADAGWVDRNGDGLVEDVDGNRFPTVDLLYTTNTPRYKWISLSLRDQWKNNLGIDVSLRGTDNKFFSADLRSGNFMVARGRWYGDYGDPTTFLDIFKTKNGNNDRGYSNSEIDKELYQAEQERNQQARYAMLRDIEERLFTEEVPMLVICQLLQLSMYDPEKIHGLTAHPRLVQHLWRVTVPQVRLGADQKTDTSHLLED
ncbi:MAG: peptide ABC transporter substrate-binding protein [Phycisphaerae bacterium]|nr:peptide ABC transporter substrate-binding protein [Phycisphaerae bacterium]